MPSPSRFVLSFLTPALALSALACAVVAGDPGDGPVAGRAAIVPPYLDRAEIVRAPGDAPSFRLVLHRDLPNPGWDLRVEEVVHEDDARIVTVRLAEVAPPPGSVHAQVITPRRVEIDLGPLTPGRYLVDVRAARPGSGETVRVAALVVAAFER